MEYNKFSIIIPVYNKERFIGRALESVLNQTYKHFEIIIVNDGSTDRSDIIVKSYSSSLIKVINQDNKGQSVARNRGVEESSNDWIIFLDADDYLLPNALDVFNNMISKSYNIKCFVANFFIEKDDKQKIYSHSYANKLIKNPFRAWVLCYFFPRTGTAVFHKDIVVNYPYNTNLRRFEDVESLFKIMRENRFIETRMPVMVWNSTGKEASRPCKKVNDDFLGHLSLNGIGYWEQMATYNLYRYFINDYPKEKSMYKSFRSRYDLKFITFIINYFAPRIMFFLRNVMLIR